MSTGIERRHGSVQAETARQIPVQRSALKVDRETGRRCGRRQRYAEWTRTPLLRPKPTAHLNQQPTSGGVMSRRHDIAESSRWHDIAPMSCGHDIGEMSC